VSEFIQRKIAWFKDPDREYGYRARAIIEEINRQEGVVASYSHIVRPNLQDQKHAEEYLAELKQAKLELEDEAVQRGMTLTEDDKIYWDMYCAVIEEHHGREPKDFNLAEQYLEFKNRYFENTVPELSEDFVVRFAKLPFDVAGASHLQGDAAKFGVRKGIRINEKLREFPAEAKVALLHEMIHAAGTRGHSDEFKHAVADLFARGAYINPLIL
jgi:hypothetical protein